MTTELLSRLIVKDYGPTWTLRLVFLANLLRRLAVNVDDGLIADARDSIEHADDRRLISFMLGCGTPPNVMKEEQCRLGFAAQDITKERIIALLRPDPKMLITVDKVEVQTEPPCEIYQVVIEDGRGGSWNEVFKTEDELHAFLRGVRATFAMSSLGRLLPDFTGPRERPHLQFTPQSTIQRLP